MQQGGGIFRTALDENLISVIVLIPLGIDYWSRGSQHGAYFSSLFRVDQGLEPVLRHQA
jgi:hypothetical protein